MKFPSGKTAILFAAAVLSGFSTCAQAIHSVELSAAFAPPKCYRSKVIQCDNGNTFLFNFKTIGCDFLLFGKDRKLIKRGVLTGRLAGASGPSGANDSRVLLLFAADSEVVFLTKQRLTGRPTLLRTIIRTDDGTVKDDKSIAELSKQSRTSSFATVVGDIRTEIYAVRDKASGNYAVIMEDGLAEDDSHKMRVDIYDRRHQKTGSIIYSKLDAKQKYLQYMDASFGKESLYICTHEFTTRSYGTEESNIVMTDYATDGAMRSQKKLAIQAPLKNFTVQIAYQQAGDRINLALRAPNGTYKKSYQRFATIWAALRPTDFSTIYAAPLDISVLDAYNEKVCNKSRNFAGMLIDWCNNEDGGTNLIIAERLIFATTAGVFGGTPNADEEAIYNYRDIGLIRLDRDGKTLGASAIQQIAVSDPGEPYCTIIGDAYQRTIPFGGKEKTMYEDWDIGVQGATFQYIHTKSNDYFIRNHPHRDFDEPTCEKDRLISNWKSSAAIYTLKDGTASMREFLLGTPSDAGQYRAIVGATSDYDPNTQTFAAVVMVADGKEIKLHIGWVRL